jgi:hypothetical protein
LGDPNNPADGSGAQNGLKNFHIFPTEGSIGCVHCHNLPEGSSNTITLPSSISGSGGQTPNRGVGGDQLVVVETAALRALRQKEPQHVLSDGQPWDPNPVPRVEVGGVGSLKAGLDMTIDRFLAVFFSLPSIPGDPTFGRRTMRDFIREFDTGTAPMVGYSHTFKAGLALVIPADVTEMIHQADIGNAGLAVHAWFGGTYHGYWYDPRSLGFREELLSGVSSSVYPLTGGGGLLPQMVRRTDRLIVYATPLGSDRRMAHPLGTPTVMTGSSPYLIEWLELAPNSAYADVSQLTQFFPAPLVANNMAAIAAMQSAFGVSPRHEPPRRLRVAGKYIRPGAVLEIALDGTCSNSYQLRLPLYPTADYEGGYPVWTTAVEADALTYYGWLTAGINQHAMQVVNQDGTSYCTSVAMTLNDWP